MASGQYIMDESGKIPIPARGMTEWGSFFESANRRIKVTEFNCLPKKVEVSTVFLALDHSFTSGADPVVFETRTNTGIHHGTKQWMLTMY